MQTHVHVVAHEAPPPPHTHKEGALELDRPPLRTLPALSEECVILIKVITSWVFEYTVRVGVSFF